MNEKLVWLIIGYALAFLIIVVTTRAVFSIPKLLKYHKAQMVLLALMAQNAGVDEDVIKNVVNETGNTINLKQ